MININKQKLNTSYIIETSNFDETIKYIKEIAKYNNFDKELIDNDTHLDFKIIKCERPKDEKNTDMRDIRLNEMKDEVIDDSIMSPVLADRKIYVIYNFNNVSINIQNTLLKTIEEPEENVHFFFLTDNIASTLNTIKSRSVIYFDNHDYVIDNIYNDKSVKLIDLLDIISNIKKKNYDEIYSFSEEYVKNNDIKLFIKIFRYFLRDTYIYKYTFDKNLMDLKIDFKYIDNFKETINNQKIGLLLKEVDNFSKMVNSNIDKKLLLTMFLINIKNIL